MAINESTNTKTEIYFKTYVDVTGEQERSTFRHIIEVIDNKITTGL